MKVYIISKEDGESDYYTVNHKISHVFLVPEDFNPDSDEIVFRYELLKDPPANIRVKKNFNDGFYASDESKVKKLYIDSLIRRFETIDFVE